eukprot:g3227.t1 g3227   contig12:1661401-1662150(-)
MILRLSIVLAIASSVFSFTLTAPLCNSRTTSSTTTSLGIIKGEAQDAVPFDENQGGVGLAKRSVIKISGVAKQGSTEGQELARYEKMQVLDAGDAKSMIEKSGCSVICSGMGKELYQDPGSSMNFNDKIVKLGPHEAAKAALASVASIGDAKSVVLNFAGGDDLIFGEVADACDMIVGKLNVLEKTKVKFNSVSFSDFEDGTCSVTVVASEGKTGGLDGVEESVARGEVYAFGDKWYTAVEGDITTADN